MAQAHPGDTIRLKKGTYLDSVFIPITLTIRGAGWRRTVIKPPAHPNNPCNQDASVEGLCAAGAFDSQGNPDVTKPVLNVRIFNLRTTGFSDTGVIGFNTRGLRVHGVRSDHNGGYGVARFVSTNSLFDDNWVSSNEEAGLYMGDSPNAHSTLRDNKADHNGFGLFMRDSTFLTATGNTVWDNCVGILALNSGEGAPGDLPAGNYRIVNNLSFENDKACPAAEGPPSSGIGIALAGVHDTVVSHNKVFANRPDGATFVSGGIVLVSAGGPAPSNNTVVGNDLADNHAADIVSDGTGTNNRIRRNDCASTVPSGQLGAWCPGH